MSDSPAAQGPRRRGVRAPIEWLGRSARKRGAYIGAQVSYVGALSGLLAITLRWVGRGLIVSGAKLRVSALVAQMVRVGVRAVPIVLLVQIFIGVILALQMAPTLQSYGQLERVADVVGIAVVRVLGPLITGIVLSGFAGASIAAEIGSMVEAEEIKALRAHALNPFRFLVVPRFMATVIAMVGLSVIADAIGVVGGLLTAVLVLDVPLGTYIELTQAALKTQDFLTGLFKAGMFGVLISMIACHEGLSVSGGAEGVGRATTGTVVKCIVALIGTDAVFTALFYAWGI
ncbi:MAG: MlaE family ABC transporter permease [Phycisphaerae bacterium]